MAASPERVPNGPYGTIYGRLSEVLLPAVDLLRDKARLPLLEFDARVLFHDSLYLFRTPASEGGPVPRAIDMMLECVGASGVDFGLGLINFVGGSHAVKRRLPTGPLHKALAVIAAAKGFEPADLTLLPEQFACLQFYKDPSTRIPPLPSSAYEAAQDALDRCWRAEEEAGVDMGTERDGERNVSRREFPCPFVQNDYLVWAHHLPQTHSLPIPAPLRQPWHGGLDGSSAEALVEDWHGGLVTQAQVLVEASADAPPRVGELVWVRRPLSPATPPSPASASTCSPGRTQPATPIQRLDY